MLFHAPNTNQQLENIKRVKNVKGWATSSSSSGPELLVPFTGAQPSVLQTGVFAQAERQVLLSSLQVQLAVKLSTYPCSTYTHGIEHEIIERLEKKNNQKIGQAAVIRCKAQPEKCFHMTSPFHTCFCLLPVILHCYPYSCTLPMDLYNSTDFLSVLSAACLGSALFYSLASHKAQIDLAGSDTCSFLMTHQLL